MMRSEAEYKQEIIVDIFDLDMHDKGGNKGVAESDLIDLCIGPYIRNTNRIKSFKITTNDASYWKNVRQQRDFMHDKLRRRGFEGESSRSISSKRIVPFGLVP
eukprot:774299_1